MAKRKTPPAPGKRRPGRPTKEERPLSARETAQRRGAAWRHGGRAETAIGQTVHPCKPSCCPLETDMSAAGSPTSEAARIASAQGATAYPCAIRQAADAADRGLDACPVELVANPTYERALRSALDGDVDALKDHTARALSAMFGLEAKELGKLVSEGFTVDEERWSPEGDVIGTVRRVNPRAAPVLELARMLGHTAADQAITPKATAERDRDRGLASLTDTLQRRAALRAAAAPVPTP
jgi:hypothetical protein